MYLLFLIENKKSVSTLTQFLASVTWFHNLGNYHNPAHSTCVQTLLEGAKRACKVAPRQKLPIQMEMIEKMLYDVGTKGNNLNLLELRDITYILLGYAGFLRYDEASSIRRSRLHIFYDWIQLDIPKSKTDPLAKGTNIIIARTSKVLCPLTWLVRYLKAAKIENTDCKYIFRAIFHHKASNSWGLKHTDKKLTYSTLAKMFRRRLASIGWQERGLTLHSLWAGGVTAAANAGVDRELYKEHGRWRSDAVDIYVNRDLKPKLSATQ